MAYSDVLSEMITESKFSIKELANLCKKQGLNITPSYISQLKSGKVNPPSDEVSRAICRICGVHEEKLVIEAFLDKAPKDIIDYIESTRFAMLSTAFTILENTFPEDILEVFKQTLSNLQLADFILEINSNEQLTKTSVENRGLKSEFHFGEDNLNITLKSPTGIPIKDNSMYPLIPEGSLITIELKENYNDGDILCFNKIGEEVILIRKCFFKDDLLILIPFNIGFKSLTLPKSEVVILGKVKTVINEI